MKNLRKKLIFALLLIFALTVVAAYKKGRDYIAVIDSVCSEVSNELQCKIDDNENRSFIKAFLNNKNVFSSINSGKVFAKVITTNKNQCLRPGMYLYLGEPLLYYDEYLGINKVTLRLDTDELNNLSAFKVACDENSVVASWNNHKYEPLVYIHKDKFSLSGYQQSKEISKHKAVPIISIRLFMLFLFSAILVMIPLRCYLPIALCIILVGEIIYYIQISRVHDFGAELLKIEALVCYQILLMIYICKIIIKKYIKLFY